MPHFHAKYAGQTRVFSIVDLKLIEGRLPKRVVALVLEWAFEHRGELMENWQRAVAQEPLQIASLTQVSIFVCVICVICGLSKAKPQVRPVLESLQRLRSVSPLRSSLAAR